MKESPKNALGAIIRKHESDILAEWLKLQSADGRRRGQAEEAEQRAISKEFLAAIVEAVGTGGAMDVRAEDWSRVRDMLTEMSSSRARQGFSPSETAMFVFSLKQPVFARLRSEFTDAGAFA